jgi:hypothetical protein
MNMENFGLNPKSGGPRACGPPHYLKVEGSRPRDPNGIAAHGQTGQTPSWLMPSDDFDGVLFDRLWSAGRRAPRGDPTRRSLASMPPYLDRQPTVSGGHEAPLPSPVVDEHSETLSAVGSWSVDEELQLPTEPCSCAAATAAAAEWSDRMESFAPCRDWWWCGFHHVEVPPDVSRELFDRICFSMPTSRSSILWFSMAETSIYLLA